MANSAQKAYMPEGPNMQGTIRAIGEKGPGESGLSQADTLSTPETNPGICTYECILGDFKGDNAPNIWGHYDGKGVVEIIYWDYSPPAGYNQNINNPWGKGRVIRVTKKGGYYF